MTALPFLASLALSPAPLAPTDLDAKVVSASLFKNGFAVVLRQASIARPGEYLMDELPNSSLGTLWIGASGTLRIEEAVNTTVAGESSVNLGSLDELLQANIGKVVTITTSTQGVYVQVTLISATGQTVLVRQQDGSISAFRKDTVQTVTGPSGLNYQRNVPTSRRLLRVRVGGTGSGNLIMLSLERGVTWAPSYLVDITDPKTLSITSKATVLNDTLNLDGVEARMVTGFPNMPYRGIQDPLVYQGSIEQWIGMLSGISGAREMAQAPGAAMMTQNAMRAEDFRGGFGGSQPVEGADFEQGEDLFFYKKPNLTLKPGDRGAFVLFRSESPYRHLFTLDVPDSFAQLTMPRPGPIVVPDPEVWNTLRWENKAGLPLTTGPAITTKGGEILGQDMISYTPNGAEALLRITKALDIRPEIVEEEVERERNKLNIPAIGQSFDLVTVKTTIEIKNGRREAAAMRVTVDRTGEDPKPSTSAKVQMTAKGLRDVNSRFQVIWEPTIDAGKTATISLSYRVFVPSRGF